jgi:hypothetical protein
MAMENFETLGRWMVIAGIVVAVVGGVMILFARIPGLKDMPGTLRIEGQGFSCVFPLLASIVLSIILTLLLNMVLRIINR